MALYHKKKQVIDQKHFLFIVCKISCKNFVSVCITVKLDFDIDRKSANFDFNYPQNISVDQMITELSTFSFHYGRDMNFSWNPKDAHNRYELFTACWNRTQNQQFPVKAAVREAAKKVFKTIPLHESR